ncbi:MAG: PAS domain-containing protein [Gemmatimonadales bacterium]
MSNKPPMPGRSRYRSLADPETLAKFAQNLGEGIYITNESGEILGANPAFLKIFGVETLDELKSYRVSDFVDWATREENETFEETVNRADRQLINVRVVRRPGSYTRRTPPDLQVESA